ncbi:MAG: hypothetical protein KAV82_03455 [Phycisphaerae bacterium]|nr:hypothetical protein [Phycisphaerae bacterium]
MEEAKLLASDGAEDDRFGRSVSISGDTAVIGAPATYGYASGSAYVFRFNGLNWVEEAKLLASDGVAGDYFGRSVSVSGDTTVIGAWADDDNGDDSGSAYVFSGWDVLFVDATATGANNGTTWADAYTELRDALAEAGTSEWITAIWVAAGTYTPAEAGGDRSASFELLNGVAIYGGFAGGETGIDQRDPVANKTILSGDLNGDDVEFLYQDENSYHVVISSYADTAVLDGFTITAGNADGTPGNDTSGAGMSNIGGSPTLKSCTFLWNRANTAGGGMSNAFGSPTLSDCVFISNYALEDGSGGAIWTFESDLTLNNCTFLWNSADKDGGGMYISSGSPTLTGCTFESNVADFDGGGIYVFSGGSPTLTNCKLSWNFTAIGDGGGMYNGWIPTLVNCQFSDNVAVNGGGIYDEAGLPTLVNCSFNGNAADDSGGGMFNNESDPLLINCAFSGNSARSDDGGGLYNDDSTLTLTNCTFSKNSAHSSGGGVYNLGDGIPWVTNCVFWQNTRNAGTETDESAQIDTGSAATIVNYSCVQGGWSGVGGIGNIDADPMFVDADGPDNIAGTEDDDLHLFGGSPCNDAGNNYAVPPWILHDRDGNTRFSDDPAVPDTGDGTPPIVDMGAYELLLDCNTNGVTDDQDISSGTSQDCNGNGIPDECERDCNANAVADECDIAAGTSVDCNNNGIPDECDLAAGTSEDCQPNDIPDECDLALGTSQDCNSNNMPDECDLVGYMTSSITNGAFETEDWTGWQRGGTGDWYITLVEDFSGNACTNDLSPIPPESKSVRMYNGGPASMYLCQTIDIPAGLVDPTLAWADVICSAGDFSENQRFSVEIGSDCCSGQAEEVLFETQRGDQLVSEEWAFREVPIEAFAGRTVDLAFKVIAQGNCFDLWLDNIHIFENRSPDCNTNSIPDECDLTAGTSNDCNTNGIPDECDIAAATSGDCNINTIPDECDLAAGTSEDCNSNDTPDECEIDQNSSAPNGPHYCTEDCAVDCNSNGIPDECDLAAGTSNDCNGNAVPDECDLAVGTSADCNSNVIPDECDVAGGTSADCQPNTIPDECEADCNANGTPDECDLAAGTSADCQSNGIPDECDIDPSDPDDNGQVSPDCNTNGVPDECETDCNTNGVPDDCDIAGGTSDDCNGNGTPDKCEIDQNSLAPNGPYYCTENCAEDCNDNGIPDECDLSACPAGNPSCADCNSNSIPDECDIDSATSTDCNNTGVPDKCELWSGDCNMNGFPDDCDVAEGTSPDVNGNGAPDECEADCNTNGVPDDWDVAIGTSWDTNSNALPDECEAALHDSLLAADAEVNGLDVISLDTLAGGLAGLLVGVSDSAVLDNVAYEPVSGMAYVALHDPADDDNLSLYRVALSMWWAFPLTNYNESPQRGAGVACALAFDASEIPHVLYLGYRDEAAGGPPYVQHIQVVNAHAGDIDLGTVIADYALDIGNIQLRGLAHHLVHDDLYAVCSVGAQGRLYRVMLNALRQEASLEFIRATSQVFDNLAYDSTRNRLVAVADSRLYEVEPTADGVDLCVGGGFVSNVDPPGLAYRDSGITMIDPSPWEEIPEGSGTARGMGISSSCAGAQYPSVAIDAETLAPVVAWSDGSVIHVRRYAPQTPDAEGEEPDMAPWKDVPPTSTGISESGAHTPAITIVPEAVAEIDGNNVYVVAWSQETFSGAREIFVKGFDGSGDTAWEEIGLWSANPFGFGISGTGVDSLDPVIASDRAGTPIIAWNEMDDEWYDFRQVYVRRWDAIAEDWVEMGAGSAVGGGISDSLLGATDVALVMDVFDRPIIAWADLDGDTGEEGEDEQYEIYVLRWNGLNAWEELSLGSAGGGGVSNSPLHDRYPALAADQLGNVYLAWSACAEEDCSCTPPGPCSQIKVRRWNSNTWSELAESMADSGISDTPGASLWPAVTVNPAGNLVVAWRDESTASAQILARAWDGDNQEWIEVGAGSAVGGGISATTHSADAGPVTLAAAADNIIVAAWHHELNDAGVDQVFVRRYTELIGPPVVGEAYDPIPESGAQFNTNGVTLAWSAGVNAAKFDVYFGTDRIQVAAATRDDDPYGLRIATDLTEMWHGPVTGLDSNTWYYWRVDSWGFGSVAPTKGAIWNFYVFSTEQLQPETRLIAAVADVSPIQGVVGLELQGDQNRGVDERLAVGLEEGQGQIRRALIKFDLCDFASTNGMLITHADLELYVAIGPMQDEEVEVYRMRHEWQEGTQQAKYGNIRGEPDGASWNTSDGVTPWPQLDAENGIYGAGYVENASDLLGSKILPAGTNGLVRIPLDTAKVQEWALLDFVNNGILVKTSNTAEARAGSAMYFHSINAQEPGAMPPQLLLEYFSSVGEPRPFLECVDGFADATCNGPTQGHLADTPYPVTLAGEGFTQGMTITVEGHDHSVIVPSELLDVSSNGQEVTFPLPPFPPGENCALEDSFEVKITVSNGCETKPDQPLVFTYNVSSVHVFPGQDLQAVINDAPAGTCIVLEPGVHDGPISFVSGKSAITVTSTIPTQPGFTKIDGPYQGDVIPDNPAVKFDNCGGRIEFDPVSGTGSATIPGAPIVLRGINVRLGNGGIVIENASPLIMDCRVDDNFARAPHAGGITIEAGSHPVIVDCAVEGNYIMEGPCNEPRYGGGIRVNAGAVPTIVGCSIASNTIKSGGIEQAGGGVYFENTPSSMIVANNAIRSNKIEGSGNGGGVCWAETAAGRFFLNIVEENTAPGGSSCHDPWDDNSHGHGPGIYCSSGAKPSLDNNLIDGNGDLQHLNKGGGIYIADFNTHSISIRENVIRNNVAQYGGAMYLARKTAPEVVRNIIADNVAHQPYDSSEQCPQPPLCPIDAYESGIIAIDAEPDLINNTIHGNERVIICPHSCLLDDDEQGSGFHGQLLVTGDLIIANNLVTDNENGWELFADTATTAAHVVYNLAYDPNESSWLISSHFNDQHDNLDTGYDDPLYEQDPPDVNEVTWPRDANYPNDFRLQAGSPAIGSGQGGVDMGVIKFDAFIDANGGLVGDGASYATLDIPYATTSGLTERTGISIEVHDEPAVNTNGRYVYVAARDLNSNGSIESAEIASFHALYEFEPALQTVSDVTIEMPLLRPITPTSPFRLYYYSGGTYARVDGVAAGKVDHFRQVVVFESVTIGESVLLRGDVNNDGKVDLDDYAIVHACLGGPDRTGGLLRRECAICDLDNDDDVDLVDYAVLQQAFTAAP